MIADIQKGNRRIIVEESTSIIVGNNIQIKAGSNINFGFDFLTNMVTNFMEKLGIK